MDLPKESVDKIVAACDGKVESIILDQWRTSGDQWSLTYGFTPCDNKCEICRLHIATTLPEIISAYPIRTFQIPATQEDRKNYGNQRALNCKSIDQYVAAFVTCFTSGYTLESIDEELRYVAGFKLIYLKGVSDLEEKERRIKKRIINEIIAHYDDQGSKEMFTKKAEELNLI